MSGDALELRPFAEEDTEALKLLLANREVARTYMLPDYETAEAYAPLAKKLIAMSQAGACYERGCFLHGKLVGFVNEVESDSGLIEVGYVIDPTYQGRGYATRLLGEAMRELRTMGYRTLRAGFFEGNLASRRVMEKCGMTPLEKTEDITYRGKTYRCHYYEMAL